MNVVKKKECHQNTEGIFNEDFINCSKYSTLIEKSSCILRDDQRISEETDFYADLFFYQYMEEMQSR